MALKLNRVLISDSVDASCREILETSGIPVDYKPGISKEDLLAVIKVYLAWVLEEKFTWVKFAPSKFDYCDLLCVCVCVCVLVYLRTTMA